MSRHGSTPVSGGSPSPQRRRPSSVSTEPMSSPPSPERGMSSGMGRPTPLEARAHPDREARVPGGRLINRRRSPGRTFGTSFCLRESCPAICRSGTRGVPGGYMSLMFEPEVMRLWAGLKPRVTVEAMFDMNAISGNAPTGFGILTDPTRGYASAAISAVGGEIALPIWGWETGIGSVRVLCRPWLDEGNFVHIRNREVGFPATLDDDLFSRRDPELLAVRRMASTNRGGVASGHRECRQVQRRRLPHRGLRDRAYVDARRHRFVHLETVAGQ